jgi:hypothetical protein
MEVCVLSNEKRKEVFLICSFEERCK